MKLYCLPLMLVMQASYAADKVEFDFHDHGQSEGSHSQWTDTNNGIKLLVNGSDNLYQNSNGLGIDDGELDAKEGHDDVMTFRFFDAKTQKPLNVLIKNLRVKMFEPKIAKDAATLTQLDGSSLPSLDQAMKYQGSAGFGKDRHSSNSWNLHDSIKVLAGFSIKPLVDSGFYVYAIEVERMNMPAEFVSQPILSTPEGQPYQYEIKIADEDIQSVTLSLNQAPQGMKFDPLTSTVSWQPGFEAEGRYDVVIAANDSEGQVSSQKFTLEVKNSNQAPNIVSKPVSTGKENLPYRYTLVTEDKDLDSVFLKLVQGPKGMQLDEETHILSWRPNFNDAGSHAIKISVSDVYDESLQTFEIAIADNNRLPSISSRAPSEVEEGHVYRYAIEAHDLDKDALSYQLLNAPKGMAVGEQSGLLTWDVDFQQAGLHAIRVQVNDGKKGFQVQGFEIDVQNINRAPVITSKALLSSKENSPYRYRILVEDADLEGVTLTLDEGPDGMKLDPASNSLYWSPSYDDQGDYQVSVIASDGEDEVTQSYTLNVQQVNRPPVMAAVAAQTISEGERFNLQLNAEDLDDSDLNFVLTQSPRGMGIVSGEAAIYWQPDYDQAGSHQVRVKAVDTDQAEHEIQFAIEVKNINRKPVINSEAVTLATENQHYFYHVSAQDKDQDMLSYTLLSAPKGMKLDRKNGYLNWKPGYKDSGQHEVVLAVTDGFNEVLQIYTLTVNNTNRDPKILSKAVLLGGENKNYAYQLNGSDADADKLSFTLLASPKGMRLDNQTQKLSWTPDWHQAGFHQVVVLVEDGQGGQAKQFFNLQIQNQNRPPVFNPVALENVFENQLYQYQLNAQDADDDRLKYKLISGPAGMTFDSYTHTLSWVPGFRSAGKHAVKVSVSDGKKQVTQGFTIRVTDHNRRPKINSVAPLYLSEGASYEYKVLASDLDTDPLNYSLLMAPADMTINEKTGQIKWMSTFEDAGQHGIEILVDDGKGGRVVQAFRVFVKNINRKPVFISEPVTLAQLDHPYRYHLLAKDADWNVLTYKLLAGPKDLALDKDSNTLYWQTDKIMAGKHNVLLELSDGTATVKQEFNIVVRSKDDMSSRALTEN